MRPSPSRRFALIEVSDDGVGIDAETRARAFEPYFSGSLLTLGSGLGLATVREILGRRGGAINLWSKVGLGTTVRMLLPIEVTAPSVEVETAPRPAVARTVEARESPVERGLTVLLVEDDEACRMAFATFLKRCGHHVLAATAEEAQACGRAPAAPAGRRHRRSRPRRRGRRRSGGGGAKGSPRAPSWCSSPAASPRAPASRRRCAARGRRSSRSPSSSRS